ncbi:MAG: signal recognition particle protein, partial [Deltaproteobacteria bacterium]|nr:signal recognition particle protein [Deltaproteobacteria bacterium]
MVHGDTPSGKRPIRTSEHPLFSAPSWRIRARNPDQRLHFRSRKTQRRSRAQRREYIDQSLRDVRTSLLEADVDLTVARDFLARVKERALGEKVATRVRDASGKMVRVTPGQHFIKICEEELIDLMGPVDSALSQAKGVTSLMLVGLQGVGKTTVAAKLARHLQKQNRRPLLVAADIYRPAAVLQLQQLGGQIDVDVFVGDEAERPASICARAKQRAVAEGFDAIIYDTAGRLAIDAELMEELAEITSETSPANTLLVCDALMGRDAVNTARAFGEQLAVDGLVLTKLDGDARGGAALAIKAVTGVPIKFLGTGESLDRLEAFRPEGLASRILGMGDVVGLVKDFEEVVDEKEAEQDAERLLRGKFGLDDLLKQLRTIQKMGPLRDVFAKLPMFGSIAEQVDERELKRVEALIQSMTPAERSKPDIIGKSRMSRIARGSGRRSKDVRELLGRFTQMRQMMSQLGSGGMLGKIPGFGKMAG